jgi:hypothetical protein
MVGLIEPRPTHYFAHFVMGALHHAVMASNPQPLRHLQLKKRETIEWDNKSKTHANCIITSITDP